MTAWVYNTPELGLPG